MPDVLVVCGNRDNFFPSQGIGIHLKTDITFFFEKTKSQRRIDKKKSISRFQLVFSYMDIAKHD